QSRMVDPDGTRAEERIEVEVPPSRRGVEDPASAALLEIDDEVVAVDEQVLAEDLPDLGRRDGEGLDGTRGHRRTLQGVAAVWERARLVSSLAVSRTISVFVCLIPSRALI